MEFRLILSSDDGYHLSYLQLVATAYRKYFDCKISLIIVGSDYLNKYVNWVGDYVDTLDVVYPAPRLNEMNNAKMARLWLASQFDNDDILMINDLDCCPMQRKYYAGKLEKFISGHIMTVGSDIYKDNEHEKGKFPMGWLTAQGKTFKEIINPENLEYNAFVDKWRGSRVLDTKEDPELGKCAFSDESLIRLMLYNWNRDELIIKENRDYDTFTDTIDRSKWVWDKKKLKNGEYIESHFHKPPRMYSKELQVIYDYIGVKQP